MNATIKKFGYPETLVADYNHWIVLLRPTQPTLGSLILAAKSQSEAFGDLDGAAFAELEVIIKAIETTLAQVIGYQRINYLMLMMVDPHVHFHVLPRYEGSRALEGIEIVDTGWPSQPDLGNARTLALIERDALRDALLEVWPG